MVANLEQGNVMNNSTMTLDAIIQRNNSNFLFLCAQQQHQQQQQLQLESHSQSHSLTSTCPTMVAPPVGLQISSKPSTSSASAAASIATFHYNSSPCVKSDAEDTSSCTTSLAYDSTIMHRVVPPTLLDVCVTIDASAFLIASTFDLPVALVNNHWITTRTPSSLVPFHRTNGYQHVEDTSPLLSRYPSWDGSRPGISGAAANQTDDGDGSVVVMRSRLNVGSISQSELTAYAHLASELKRKLAPIARQRAEIEQHMQSIDYVNQQLTPSLSPSSSQETDNVDGLADREETEESSGDIVVDSNLGDTINGIFGPKGCGVLERGERLNGGEQYGKLKVMKRVENCHARASARCGFATKHTHADLTLHQNRSSVSKRKKGLYRAAMSASSIATDEVASYYMEVEVLQACGEGGICIGLSSREAPLNRVVGTGKDGVIGVGLHSAGKLVVGDVWRDIVCRSSVRADEGGYNSGDVVGVRVDTCVASAGSPFSSADDVDADTSASSSDEAIVQMTKSGDERETCEHEQSGADVIRVSVSFFVNGTFVTSSALDMPKPIPLSFSVSLYREGSEVALRCCSSSWEFLDSSISSSSNCEMDVSCTSTLGLRSMCDSALPPLVPPRGMVSKSSKSSLTLRHGEEIPSSFSKHRMANSLRSVVGGIRRVESSTLENGCASVLTP